MFIALALLAALTPPSTSRPPERADTDAVVAARMPAPDPRAARPLAAADTLRRRRAVEHSDAYYTRLTIHKYASLATVPLLVGQYVVGQRLYDRGDEGGMKSAHVALGLGIAGLFGVNTITGGWNLVEGWPEPGVQRKVHGVLMLLADAGFATTALLTPDDDEGGGDRRRTHRAVAIGSMATALVGYVIMLPPFHH